MQLHEPIFRGNELKYLKECLSTNYISFGKYIDKFEKKISKILNIKYAIAVKNGTSALHISLKLAGANINTEVIVPTITFISPVNAIIYNNASPIFMDSDDFFNIDLNKTIEFIEENTYLKQSGSYNKKTNKKIVAIIIVHVFGNASDFYELKKICKKRKIKIIEDASESFGTKYIKGKFKNKFTGSIGDINCLSFNGNKILTSGGGGMILTNNKEYYLRSKYLIDQAKDDSVKYIHNDVGYNYRFSNLHAAIGLAQLEKINEYIKIKKNIHNLYKFYFDGSKGLSILDTPKYSKNNNWLNILLIDSSKYPLDSYRLVKKLINKNIFVRNIWLPNHMQKMYKLYETYKIKNAVNSCKNAVCLPSGINITEKDIKKIFKIIYE